MKWKPRKRRPVFRDCLFCADTFEVEPPRGCAKTCSPECSREWKKIQQRAYHAANLEANRDEINARRRRNYVENPEPILERNSEWALKHREPINARLRHDYAAKKGSPVREWRREAKSSETTDG